MKNEGTAMGVNGMAAAQTMLGFGTWRRGRCLEAVWQAYARNGAEDRTGQSEPTAYDAWLHTDAGDRRTGVPYDKIPAGLPVYFGPKASSKAGDIVISLGGGWCVATDIPGHPGRIGKMRLADRQRQIGRPYLGYSTTILDYPITQGETPAPNPTPAAPNIIQEDDMAPIIIAQRSNAALAKGRYIGGGKIQEITRAENNLLRAAQKENPEQITYANVSDADYAALLKGAK